MESQEALLDEARRYTDLLSDNLPIEADPLSFSKLNSKLPYVALCYREAQFFRIEELARGFIESADRRDAVVSILTARAITESVSGVWYLQRQVLQAIDDKLSPDDLHRKLVKLLTGRRTSESEKQAVQVLNFVDSVEKEVPGFRKRYELLSEYSHPNWDGALGLFGRRDEGTHITYFGRREERIAGAITLALNSFIGSVGIFLNIYNDLGDQLVRLDFHLDEKLGG